MKKVVVVSGGSDGLGKDIAKQLVGTYTVVILSPTPEKLEKTAAEIGCDFAVCDVSDYAHVSRTITEILSKHGRIDCLINNAALWIQGELDENDADYLVKVVQVNLTGVMLLTKAVIPTMKQQKEGLIININSQAGLYAKKERSIYNATKWGLTGFTKSLESELAKYGIRVTGIYPGKLSTHMFKKMGIEKNMDDALNTQEVAKAIEFILTLDANTVIPELGIKFKGN